MRLRDEPGGLIFDCDGTLADTMPLHFMAWQGTLQPLGVDFSEKYFYELGGMPTPEIVRLLNERDGASLDPDAIAARKEELYVELLPQAQPIQLIVDLVHHYRGRVPMAVASGGIRRLVVATLDGLGITEAFQVIATAEDVERGKPEPDLFLFTARQLDVLPEECVVYEDSVFGLEAARRAGMKGIDIRELLLADQGASSS